MKLLIQARLDEIADANLDHFDATLDEIDSALTCVAAKLTEQLWNAKLNRLVRFCQTGTIEHGCC